MASMLHDKKLIEKLAKLSHDDWANWTQHFFDNQIDVNVQRWKRQAATPYEELSEEEKDKDREHAKRYLIVICKHLFPEFKGE